MYITDIYKEYNTPPQLQQHQFRVAAVGSIVCDGLSVDVDKTSVIQACLLHDMGNIIKFDLTLFPEFREPEGLEYWQKVKKSFINKYGRDEHIASIEIAGELGVNDRVLELIHSVDFDKLPALYETSDFGVKVCSYADYRVNPYGVGTLKDRIEDGAKRYVQNQNSKTQADDKTNKVVWDRATFEKLAGFAYKIEDQIFSVSNIKPEDINNDKVELIIPELKKYDL